jgi:hypothetical protein
MILGLGQHGLLRDRNLGISSLLNTWLAVIDGVKLALG